MRRVKPAGGLDCLLKCLTSILPLNQCLQGALILCVRTSSSLYWCRSLSHTIHCGTFSMGHSGSMTGVKLISNHFHFEVLNKELITLTVFHITANISISWKALVWTFAQRTQTMSKATGFKYWKEVLYRNKVWMASLFRLKSSSEVLFVSVTGLKEKALNGAQKMY